MEGRQQQQTELKDVFNLLESQETHVIEDIKKLIQENLSSNREPWLVQSLVDYYYTTHSRSVISIFTKLREPHDKHLLEKLHDGIKSPEHQLLALQLLLHVVCQQPSWIQKVVSTSVFKVIIKCLKVETNIPVLMTGVTTVAILLPSVPTLIGPYLPELFEIFNRLASFSVRKPAGNIPDVFLLHLEVSVYALFHRLYGMFPYNLLTYLRHYYTKKENSRVFEEVVQSMLERVRLHPNLITGTKDQETSKERWRQMESQDVVVECAKMSLDLVEGTWEELHCPIVASRYYRRPQTACQRRNQFSPQLSDAGYSVRPKPEVQSLSLDNVFWSPSEVVGLSTPPASQRTTPGPSVLETSTSSNVPHLTGLSLLTPLLTPPVNTPTETPPISDEVDKPRVHGSSKSQDPKRLSSEFSVSQTVPLMTPSSHIPSIPPSPLKPEFTSTPPFGLLRTLPVLNAARELQFDNPPSDQSDVSPQEIKSCNQSGVCSKQVVKPVQLELRHKEQLTPDQGIQSRTEPEARFSFASEVGELTDSLSKSVSITDEMRPRDNSGASQTETVSIDNISQVIESLEKEADIDDDDEVSELTSSSRSHNTCAMLTAESVAKFMKSVNRIRFNSLTSRKSVEKLTKLGSRSKSLSCPLLPKIDTTMEEEEALSRSASTTFQNKSYYEQKDDLESAKSSEEVANLSVHSTASTVTVTTKQETSVTIATSEASSSLNITKCPMYTDSVLASRDKQEDDFIKVFRVLLNPASVAVCQRCQSQTLRGESEATSVPLGRDGPLFSGYSPPELLDRHLQLGSDIHTKELSKIPIPCTQSINWTHFGGMPPADEINIVRGQLLLLHNQLLYERHKREQHAKRNRRLLRKIAHAKTMEEQNRVMANQIHLNENTIHDMQVSLKLLLEENRKLKNAKESEEYEKLVHVRTCLQENEDLKAAKKEFSTLFVRQREDQDNLRKKLMTSDAKLFNTEKELEYMRQQAVINSKLKEQVIQLHKELLLMGELQQKSQEKLQSQKIAHSAKQEHEYIQASLTAEIKVLKAKLESKTVRLEECRRRQKEQQEQLNIKEIALAESKRNIERIKISHDDEIKSVEAKHKASLYMNQALESHILEVYREVEDLKTKVKKQGLYRHTSHAPEVSSSREPHGHHSNDLLPEGRERTNSDPLRQKEKKQLMRMGSEPLDSAQTSRHSQDPSGLHKSFDLRSHEGSRRGERSTEGLIKDKVPHEPGFSEKLDIVESGDFVVASISSRDTDIDRQETESLSSSSILHPSGADLLYTDSEDSRSMSNRSSNFGDSGYIG